MNKERNRFEYLNGPINFIDYTSMVSMFMWTMDDLQERSIKGGFTGIELMPTRMPRINKTIKNQQITDSQRDYIKSIEQSYRGERGLKGIREEFRQNGLTRGAVATVSYITLPYIHDSIQDIEDTLKALGKDVPAVVYLLESLEVGTEYQKIHEKMYLSRFPNTKKLFQPTADIMTSWGVNHVTELSEVMREIGYSGFALDLYHARRGQVGKRVLNKEIDLETALNNSDEIHVSLGRIDIESGIDTIGELKDIYTGTYESETANMLRLVSRHQQNGTPWSGRIKVEVPFPILCNVAGVGKTDRIINFDQVWSRTFSRSTDNVKYLLEGS